LLLRCTAWLLEAAIESHEHDAEQDEPADQIEKNQLAAYVAIAVLIVPSVWMFAMHQARTGGSPNLPWKWLGFAGMTAIVFGYAIRACRQSWGKQKFWALLGRFFAVHSGLGVFVLLRVPVVPLVLYAVLTALNTSFSAAYLVFSWMVSGKREDQKRAALGVGRRGDT